MRVHVASLLLLSTAVAAPAHGADAPAPTTITVSRAGAPQYGPDASLTCKGGGVNGALGGEYKDRARSNGKQPPVNDGRLCAVAEALLAWDRPTTPPESVLRELSWYFGLPTTVRRVIIATIATEDSKDLAERFAEGSAGFAFSGNQPRFGAASKRLARDLTRVALVVQDTPVELQPVPRSLPAGGRTTLTGKLAPDLGNAKIYAGDPAGKLEVVPQAGPDLHADLACGEKPGRLLVDVRAERAGAPTVVAKLAIACGVPPESKLSLTVPPPAAAIDPAAAEKRIFELANAERAAAGLPPLAWDDAVAGVARQLSDSFRAQEAGQPADFDLAAALKKAQIAALDVLQNPAEARSADEAAAANAASPVNRANVLSRNVTHLGVGVVTMVDPRGSPLLFATELLVRELAPFDPAEVRTRLEAAIAARRKEAGASPVTVDPLLAEVAQKYADLLARTNGKPSKEEDGAVIAPLYKAFKEVNLMPGVAADPLDAAKASGVTGKGTLLGVGAASGVSDVLGKNSPYVTVILATKQEKASAAPAAAPRKKKGH